MKRIVCMISNCLFVAGIALTAPAGLTVFQPQRGVWNSAANWSPNLPASVDDHPIIYNSSVAMITNAVAACGNVYIGHATLVRNGANYRCCIKDGERVSGHRPSVDVLFQSFAEAASGNAAGVILTGMGSDGAKGLLEMRRAGAFTIGQDEASSLIYGMPKAWVEGGVADEVLPLGQIGFEISKFMG